MTMRRTMRFLQPLVVAFSLSGCPEQPANEFMELTSFSARRFKLTGAVDGSPVSFPSSSEIILYYDPSLKAVRTEAFGNLYTIEVGAADDGSLEWGGVQGTLIAVPEELSKAAVRYTNLIVAARRVEKRPDGMALLSRDGTKALEYRYAARP